MTTYNRLLFHPGLFAPIRRALLAGSTFIPRSRLEIWENEGGALGLIGAYIRGADFRSSPSSFL